MKQDFFCGFACTVYFIFLCSMPAKLPAFCGQKVHALLLLNFIFTKEACTCFGLNKLFNLKNERYVMMTMMIPKICGDLQYGDFQTQTTENVVFYLNGLGIVSKINVLVMVYARLCIRLIIIQSSR